VDDLELRVRSLQVQSKETDNEQVSSIMNVEVRLSMFPM
jgi:hypothetical protein